MKNSKKLRLVRTLIASLLMALMVVSLSAPEAMAKSKTKTMTVYDQVVVNGDYAYCSAYKGLYKVNLTTGSKTLLVKSVAPDMGATIGEMKIYKGYLYYVNGGAVTAPLYRIKLSGKNKKYLGSVVYFAISNGKIYYKTLNSKGKYIKKSMKLTGKSKKKSSYNVKMKWKDSNKSGYTVNQVLTHSDSVYDDVDESYYITDYYTDYFVTPSGEQIALCDYTIEYSEW